MKAFKQTNKQTNKKKIFYYGTYLEYAAPYLNFKYRNGKLTLVDPNIYPPDYEQLESARNSDIEQAKQISTQEKNGFNVPTFNLYHVPSKKRINY